MKIPLGTQLAVARNFPSYQVEYTFDAFRKWRFDIAWPEYLIAAEQEGGTWSGGRHVRGKGYAEDCAKYNAATLAGWRVYRFTTDQIASGEAIATLTQAFAKEGARQ